MPLEVLSEIKMDKVWTVKIDGKVIFKGTAREMASEFIVIYEALHRKPKLPTRKQFIDSLVEAANKLKGETDEQA